MKLYLATCDSGLEDLALLELRQKTGILGHCRPQVRGRIWFETENIHPVFASHSLHHIIELVGEETFERIALEEVCERAMQYEWKALAPGQTFRCTCNRTGKHEFSSVEVERKLGGALVDSYQLKVDLKNFEREALVSIEGNQVLYGLRETRHPLSHRYQKAFTHRGAIKYTLAHAMLQLLRPWPGARILDPFCGSGSIVMEAAALLGDQYDLFAGDIFGENIHSTRENLALNSWEGRVEVKEADARNLHETFPGVSHIVCNLPFGKRVAKGENLTMIFRRFLESAAKALPAGGRIVALANHGRRLQKEAGRTGQFHLLHARSIRVGTLYPQLVVLEKKSG